MAKINNLPPLEFLQSRFEFDPENGVLRYLTRVSQSRPEGTEAGFVHWTGYRYVKFMFDGVKMQAAVHRIGWALFHSKIPPSVMEIDHIDRNKLNNKITNLRLVTRAENARNRDVSIRKSGSSFGVSKYTGRDSWRAYKYVGGRYVHLGTYKTEIEAAAAVSMNEAR